MHSHQKEGYNKAHRRHEQKKITGKQYKESMKPKGYFFKKTTKLMNHYLDWLIKLGSTIITIDLTEIKIIREYYEQLYANKWESLYEVDKFL